MRQSIITRPKEYYKFWNFPPWLCKNSQKGTKDVFSLCALFSLLTPHDMTLRELFAVLSTCKYVCIIYGQMAQSLENVKWWKLENKTLMLKRYFLAHYFKVLTRDIGEIWSDVDGKRQTWICTSWPSFLFSFRSQFVVTSRKSADSSQFYPKELFWAVCIRSFCILRICQLESDVCRKRDSTSLYFELAIFVMFGNFPNLRNFP